MKIPTNHIDLSADGYAGYWVDVPKSLTEGWLYDWQRQQDEEAEAEAKRQKDEGDAFKPRPTHEVNRESMLKLLELVTAWNIDDSEGKVLPLVKNTKSAAQRAQIIKEIPLDVFLKLQKAIVPQDQEAVPEGTKDFSNAS